MSLTLEITLMSKTVIIAPADTMPTKPKLSSSETLLSFFSVETPAAIANINGTVIAPVVAPEASKDIAKKMGDENKHKTKIIKYSIVSSLGKRILYAIFIKPVLNKAAIPMDTTITILVFVITELVKESTRPASICKSGSATDITKPSINPATIINHVLLLLAMPEPIKFPMGVIPISTPNRKIDKPNIIKSEPNKNLINKGVSRGVIVKLSTNTMNVMGSTEYNTSFSFCIMTSNYMHIPSIIYCFIFFVNFDIWLFLNFFHHISIQINSCTGYVYIYIMMCY